MYNAAVQSHMANHKKQSKSRLGSVLTSGGHDNEKLYCDNQ